MPPQPPPHTALDWLVHHVTPSGGTITLSPGPGPGQLRVQAEHPDRAEPVHTNVMRTITPDAWAQVLQALHHALHPQPQQPTAPTAPAATPRPQWVPPTRRPRG